MSALAGFAADLAPSLVGLLGPVVLELADGATIREMMGDASNLILTEEEKPIGCYCGEVLIIERSYRGRGYATPLILETVKRRPLPKTRKLTQEGKRALTRAWLAVNQGKYPNDL